MIEQYLDKEHKGCYRYYYLGIPLKEYCDENNLNYKNIIAYIGNYKKNDGFKNLTDDELVEVIMDKYQPFKPKYLYKGLTLREYCNKNNLSYYSVVSFVKRKLANGSTKSVDNLAKIIADYIIKNKDQIKSLITEEIEKPKTLIKK